VPLGQAAEVERGHAYTQIKRIDGRRVINVTADVVPGQANANEVVASVVADLIPDLRADYPRLGWAMGGEQKSQAETIDALLKNGGMALLAMLVLLAVAFRSYAQPFIVMWAIPFGWVGAVLGHVIMGYDLSLLSAMGMIALSGVVVNSSLILIVAINEYRASGLSLMDGLLAGGTRRFRPILLTSLTTFLGLAPMIAETSVQARFLIPMAISLGFGVLFATFITLFIVPAGYAVVEDVKRSLRGVKEFVWPSAADAPAAED
jgi:multidrug efflux pump subunit AcrB